MGDALSVTESAAGGKKYRLAARFQAGIHTQALDPNPVEDEYLHKRPEEKPQWHGH
jgi:hypothetical protein